MRTETMNAFFPASAHLDDAAQTEAKTPTVWSRVFDAIRKGQEARAGVIIARHLALYDDATLKNLGWSSHQIASLRKQGLR